MLLAHSKLDALKCPISRELMRNPVSTVDGHVYEERHIRAWFGLGRSTSPMTNLELPSTDLREEPVRSLILSQLRESGKEVVRKADILDRLREMAKEEEEEPHFFLNVSILAPFLSSADEEEKRVALHASMALLQGSHAAQYAEQMQELGIPSMLERTLDQGLVKTAIYVMLESPAAVATAYARGDLAILMAANALVGVAERAAVVLAVPDDEALSVPDDPERLLSIAKKITP